MRSKWITLSSLWLLLLLQLLNERRVAQGAPRQADYIADSERDAGYIDEVMQQAKAAEMGNFMNESVDPCQNFYEFACGNYARINPATVLAQLTTGLFERLSDGFNRKVKQALNSKNNTVDTEEDVQVQNFYHSCMAVREIGRSYRQKMKDLIAEFGTMPVLVGDSWSESDFDWLETIARIAYRYGYTILVGIDINKDFANNEANVIYINQQEFPLETRSMYLDDFTAVYRDTLSVAIASKLVTFLGIKRALALVTAKELMDFEVQLAYGLVDALEGLDIADITELTTVAEMQSLYAPVLDVERLVNISMGKQIKDPVYNYNPDYHHNLIKVIQRTPKRIVANYIFYRLIDEFTLQPGKTLAKRQEKCITVTLKNFAKNLDNMIYRRHNNNDTAADLELIWRQLKSTFEQTLQTDPSLNWISRRTRQSALEKLQAMTLQINSHANENLTEDFGGLKLQSEDYVENLRLTYILAASQKRDMLYQPVKPMEVGDLLSYTPANVLVENTIKVPVSLLQPYYLWAANYPNAIKFGALASLIGHELIHGFDDSGRKFDAQGNVNTWWDFQSTANFIERQSCFTKQYSRYVYSGIQLPKSNAQSENIADNGGVRLAYAAYRNLLNAQEATVEGRRQLLKEKLPTLNYTKMQLFFISYAQIWCNDAHLRVRSLKISMDQHVPGEFRVIGPLSNFEEFAREFHCERGTPMNPQTKCKIY